MSANQNVVSSGLLDQLLLIANDTLKPTTTRLAMIRESIKEMQPPQWMPPRIIHRLEVYETDDGLHHTSGVMTIQECGKIVGGGTCQHPLEIQLSPRYAAANEMYSFIQSQRDQVLGGDDPATLDGWAAEFVNEADAILAKARSVFTYDRSKLATVET